MQFRSQSLMFAFRASVPCGFGTMFGRSAGLFKEKSRTLDSSLRSHCGSIKAVAYSTISRELSTSACQRYPRARTPNLAPRSRDRGPASKEDTQTDFKSLNVLGNTPPPATAIDACLSDGFHLSNGVKITGGAGCLLISGEVFRWQPWSTGHLTTRASPSDQNIMINAKRQWEAPQKAWSIFELIWPKPELLILGMGPELIPLSSITRQHVNELGLRVDILDTRNAAAQFNLLATERGVETVAAALLPVGRKL